MSGHKAQGHPVAKRLALASLSMLAAGAIGVIGAPVALGQIVIPIGGGGQSATTSNAGSGSASTGGNTSVGNGSTNSATTSSPGLLGSLLGVPLSLGAPTNTSSGTSTVNSGPASATGNQSSTGVQQSNASGNQVNGFLASQGGGQSAGVSNAGAANAGTGGNTSVGNGSQNNASVTQNVGGGLVGVAVNLGGPTNNSTGTSNITTGPATASGNQSNTGIDQASVNGGGVPGPGGPFGGGAVCGARFSPFPGQDAGVANRGQATADTGGNVSVGNGSTNNASTNLTSTGQTVSGGVAGVGLNLGGPTNTSSGTSNITTGPATAVGNLSSTNIDQACGQVAALSVSRPPVVVVPAARPQQVQAGTLARTGLDAGALGLLAAALLAGGMLLVASQRRRMEARLAGMPRVGPASGPTIGTDDWDRPLSGR